MTLPTVHGPPGGQHHLLPGRPAASRRCRRCATGRRRWAAAPPRSPAACSSSCRPRSPAGGPPTLLVRGGTPGATVDVWIAKRGEEAALRRRGGRAVGEPATTAPTVHGRRRLDGLRQLRRPGDAAGDRPAHPGAHRRPGQRAGRRCRSAVRLTALAGTPVTVTATGTPGAAVSLWLRREGDAHFARAGARGASTPPGASRPATPPTGRTRTSRGRRAPSRPRAARASDRCCNELDLAAPATVVAGRTVTARGAGHGRARRSPCGSPARGSASFTRRREGVLGADGMYRTSFVAGVDHVFFATSGDRSSARRTTRTTGAPAAPVDGGPGRAADGARTVAAGAERAGDRHAAGPARPSSCGPAPRGAAGLEPAAHRGVRRRRPVGDHLPRPRRRRGCGRPPAARPRRRLTTLAVPALAAGAERADRRARRSCTGRARPGRRGRGRVAPAAHRHRRAHERPARPRTGRSATAFAVDDEYEHRAARRHPRRRRRCARPSRRRRPAPRPRTARHQPGADRHRPAGRGRAAAAAAGGRPALRSSPAGRAGSCRSSASAGR